mgnify:CR=1 FL=1
MSNRRDLFRSAAKAGLALGLAAAGQPLIAVPNPGDERADDVGMMNTALALEHEAIRREDEGRNLTITARSLRANSYGALDRMTISTSIGPRNLSFHDRYN